MPRGKLLYRIVPWVHEAADTVAVVVSDDGGARVRLLVDPLGGCDLLEVDVPRAEVARRLAAPKKGEVCS